MYKEERKFVEKEGKLANCLLTLRESCVLTEPSPSTNCSTKDRSLQSPARSSTGCPVTALGFGAAPSCL